MRLNRIRIPRAIRRHVLVLSGKGTNLNLRGAIVPSLLGATCGNCFRFKLSHGQKSRYSASFGSTKAIFRSKKFQQTEYIDFFIGYALARFRLEVESLPPQAAAKNTALLIAHRLPRRMGSPRHEREVDLMVPELSQMPYEENPHTYRRLCMPACVFMICRYFSLNINFSLVKKLCFNKETKTYGVWPQAIFAGQCVGLDGAVIFINNVSELMDILSARLPVVAALRFGEGEIQDFPFRSTGGHMVVVRGTSSGDIIVNDPAHSNVVRRRYPADLFMKVWTKSRPEIGSAVGLVFWKSCYWPLSAQSRCL